MYQKIDGNDLMLFIQNKSVGYATNHTLTLQVNVVETTSKQSGGIFSCVKPQSVQWSITSENMYSNEEANRLIGFATSGTQLTVIFGRKSSNADTLDDASLDYWSPVASGYWTGKAYITSIEVNSPTGEKARFSIALQGSGEIELITT